MTDLVKTEFDFGWKKWTVVPEFAELALQYQKGDILDVGCATCQLYQFLREKGWQNNYYGMDCQKFEHYEYPKGVNLIIGDALKLEFPEVDTVILYNILEHVSDPVTLLKKSLEVARKNVLIYVPKRNEEMWRNGIIEFHQLDKSHQHCGFSKEDLNEIVSLSHGKIASYKDMVLVDATIGSNLWNNRIPRFIVGKLIKIFSSKKFYQEIWCEVVLK
ncbi:methylase UbiE [Methanobacterium sp. MZ-A1]|uniref:Methylase UbiE n=1 Tax=Methanobacterium subterraneum TaxID=59277 RepID=A0A2H4VED8_9EURY|nr:MULTISPECIES: methyltransferase domain-containing protein [Methanobacterium]AUB56463.1 methylase UbiE [Methanobacterium subterraneum]AUB58667.1 methylase UbiE [Methanobacterium sp. MZ-A1]MBW4257361.1 class I SAM-dependent methyltransferase [Methanobacterium sp. YSL]